MLCLLLYHSNGDHTHIDGQGGLASSGISLGRRIGKGTGSGQQVSMAAVGKANWTHTKLKSEPKGTVPSIPAAGTLMVEVCSAGSVVLAVRSTGQRGALHFGSRLNESNE